MKESSKGLVILLIVVLIAAGTGIMKKVSAAKSSSIPFGFSENSGGKLSSLGNSSKPYIAVIDISGVIQEKGQDYNQQWLLSTIRKLKADDKNKGILLFINSPGGTVYHSDEAYLALNDYKTSGKNVYAYFGTMAASGGYYIACAADKIYANRNTITGSIGVISASTIDATELMSKIGIKSTTIHAGKNKNMLNWNESPTEEQLQIMQSLADEAYDQFTQIVSRSRKMKIDKVRELADGRIYSAKQAKENGLVDDVLTIEEAKEAVKADYNFDSLIFRSYRYEKNESLRSLLLEGISAIKNPRAAFNQGTYLSYIVN
jgi:protease-4